MGEWWRDAVFYEVYVRSFADSGGDGVGDLHGLRARLPHLAALGVDAVWVTPFYPSPMADHGYDVADPCDVDPLFGDLAAFDALLADAHALGLRVVVDVVPNHVSVEHRWFQEALRDPAARRRFLFREGRDGGPPNDWQSVFGGPAWTQVPDGAWYLHLFDSGQPDLDWREPEVGDEWERVLRFWLDRGVDGFRIDVAHALFKAPGLPDAGEGTGAGGGYDALEVPVAWDQPEVVEVYERWRRVTDSYDGDRMMVGEVFLLDVERVRRYVAPGRLHQAFDFTVMAQPFEGPALRRVVETALEAFEAPTWVLSNHDLVRHVTRYGGGSLGRRRGLAVTALLLALPGAPYLYQGEELGLDESEMPASARQDPVWRRTGGRVAGRDGCRTPLPWEAAGPGHGFTTGTPWLPFGDDAAALAVDVQERDPSSVLAAYRRLLARRRSLRGALPREVTWLPSAPDVLALRRGPLVCVLNTAAEPVEVPVDGLLADGPGDGVLLEATADGAGVEDGVLTVPAAATVWLSTAP